MGWSNDLQTGIDEIDLQHREFFAELRALDAAARRGDLLRAVDTLDYLATYITNHFSTEERHMAAAAYPAESEHREEHRAFVAEFLRRKAEYEANRSLVSLILALNGWLLDWLREHIRGTDARMADHLRSRGLPQD